MKFASSRFAAHSLLAVLLLSSFSTVAMAKSFFLYIATQNPGGMGIAAAEFDSDTGVLSPPRMAIETPNPECLAIFATHFYLDPTHTRPIPAPLLRFYLEEAGFGSVQIERLAPAVESMPALAELPPAFRDAFFGGLDYAIVARKL